MQNNEWVLLHDFYWQSPEPDSPQYKFSDLGKEDQNAAQEQYQSDSFKSVFKGSELIGFVGFFPDDHDNINLFYVIAPEHRAKGHLFEVLKASLLYCRSNFLDYKYVRALTRKENVSSIKGIERFGFLRKGSITEEVQPDVIYEEYLLPL